jgi:hypothetical protein
MLDEASSSQSHECEPGGDEYDADVMSSDCVVDDPEIVTSLPFGQVRLCLLGRIVLF